MKDSSVYPDAMGIMYEKRPLKRPRLGPPDVYPQDARQKEDELTSTNVKHGFSTTPQSSDEFGTARNFNYSASKIGQFFSGILSKKEELNTLPDCGRKRQQVNTKDNFWPATARTKPLIEAWFKDLAGGKPLSQLAKRAPNFNKKEEIFITLTEYQVSMPRAAWFIKLSSAYTVAVSEAKIKKRQLPDPTTEWTTTLIKFLKDQIPKLAEYYQSGIPGNPSDKTPPSQSGHGTPSHNSSGSTPGSSTPNSTVPNSMHSPGSSSNMGSSTPGGESTDWRQALKLWNYCCRLAKYLLDEGLLDRHDFLTWIIELLDKRAPDDGLLKLFLPVALQHVGEFVNCESLSRRLATTCAKKAAAICSVLSETTLRTLNQPAVFTKPAERNETELHPLSPPQENADIKPNISQIKRSSTPAEQSQGTPNPNHSLGTPNPSHPLGTPNPPQQHDVQVKEERASPPRDVKTTLNTVITAALNPIQVGFAEVLNCAYHRDVVIQLATILQIICVECPTAMVWSGCGSSLQGSPLDLLPVPPSALPMPHMDSAVTEEHRRLVYEAEQEISARSKKAESKWCTDKWQTSSQARVLAVLEALDRHCFDRVDPNNSLDTLYKEVFANCTPPSKDSNIDTKDPEWACSYAVVRVLCEWAVCGARWGEHRALAAAALLDRRQHQLHHHHDHHATGSDDKESISSGTGIYNGPPIFQNLLLRFLDNDAPVLDESPNAPPGNRQQFANLVHLFGELIRRDVFSHDAYMCTLISRGDLVSPTEPTSTGGGHTVAPPANSTGTNHNMDDDIFAGIDLKPKMEENVRMDLDDSKIDDDLDKLLQHIKEDQQNSMDAPDSPKDPGEPSHSVNSPMMGPSGMSIPGMPSIGMGPMSVPGIRAGGVGAGVSGSAAGLVSRHYHYTMHFPLPPAEPDHAPHDANQRHILLYGVGRQRDDAKHAVKKMTKEICKLFSKKFSIDVAEGGKIKKHSRSEFNFEAVTQKFQAMSMYEQGAVSWAVGGAVCEALAAYAAGATTYLPQPEHVAFALDLMEIALNVHGLIETCIQILKELSEVEGALTSRGAPSSGIAAPRAYTSALALYTVGALRRYHSCLLLCVEQTSTVFEQLCRLVKCVVNPGDCGSAERCVLAQLHDLYKAAAHLCHAPHADTFANAYPKIKQALYSPLQPIPSNYVYNPQFLSEFFTNPRKGKIEIAWARQVAESPANRYSFVCSAMLAVCREVDNDRVNELGVLCAEMTAWCSGLAAEWLGALVALCGAQHYPASTAPHAAPPPLYPDLLHHRDLHDAAAHDALAVFTCILVARHCFSLEDFVRHAALPSLLKACGGANASTNPANAPSPDTGARLTCHLLLRLFKTVDTPQPGLYSVSTSPGPGGSAAGVRLSCDRHLLAAAHKNIGVGPVLATLKAILMVGDSARDGGKSGKKSCELSHILGTSDTVPSDAQLDLMSMVDSEMSGGHRTPRGSGGVGSTLLDSSQSLASLARRVLAEICSEEWVLQKCLQNPDELYQPDMLLDSMLTPRQAQRLLHMICYPDSASHTHPDLDQKTMITRLLENLEQWSLRMSWLDLQLMFKQFPSGSAELSAWLDTVARAVINVFQQPAPPPPDKDRMGTDRGVVTTSKWSESVWLVAPLVAKLPAAVQGRVLKQAGQILESGWGAGCSGNCSSGGGGGGGSHRDCKSHQSPSYKGSSSGGGGGKRGVSGAGCGGGCACGGGSAVRLANEPLLSLVLTCLRHQDDQKESLLSSIHAQLQHYLTHARDHERSACNDTWQDEVAPEALQLRFSLAGGMFDAIRRSYQLTSDWAVLLTQLVAHQVVDAYNNSLCRSNLFTTLIDMLATLIHSTLADGGDDNNRKHYQNLMKKLKKEIGDRHGPSVQCVRQLLPLSKNTIIEVIACEPLGCLVDQKGNKITGFDSDKKQGLRLTDKQRVSVWELVEGGRNPAPLSWAWFGAIKIERKPLTYENAHRLLKYHTHSLVKPLSYYLEPLPLPPEDLETNDSKQDSGSLDSSPTGAGKSRSRSSSCKNAKKMKPTTPTGVAGGAAGAGPAGALAPQQPQQPQFMHQQQQWFPPPGQNYYNPPAAGVNTRAVAPPSNTHSKQALSNMLRQRVPNVCNQMTQMQGGGGYPGGPHRGPFPPRQGGMRQMQPNQMGTMQPQQMNPMGSMSGMGPMTQMGGLQIPGQMGGGQMGAGQMGAGQMGAGQMSAGQMSAGQMGGMGGQMFGGQYGGMQQGYGGYGQQMMQGGQQQMMNQGMGQSVSQMGQQVNPMAQGVNPIAQNVGQMSQAVGQSGQIPQGMGQMNQGMSQMGQPMAQMSQMGQGGGMGGMNGQGGSMGPQGGNGMGGFPGQQSFQQNMMGGRASQEAYLAQQRQSARPPYMQQAPNVTMSGMGGPAPPYPRAIQPQQSAQYQQQMTQQRMRQQMLAMQQQQQQQGPLVQHLQRQQYQPPY
ncbi:mediator of RNA polymerase II transcription subunit 12 isoform X3 [Manduca sexta]|uniref:mediator of RNA polymerase II transcription subunit 12 isoform X3 n=1 Tax=Manduca sexta TaxID=7130 RepID=UPI001183D8EF|nr:mediator of RNA polymerase II transcription subunit 12 isoform X3 [Manduca sexta]